jgi:hypothetical protein
MKKLLLVASCMLFCIHAYCQSLSVNDFAGLLSQQNVGSYLKSKSFEPLGLAKTKGPFATYIKNINTNNEEKLYFRGPTLSYLTKNKAYMNNLLKQFQAQGPPAFSDDNETNASYGFKYKNKLFSLIVAKKPNEYSSLSVR